MRRWSNSAAATKPRRVFCWTAPDSPFTDLCVDRRRGAGLGAMQARLRESHPGLTVVPVVADFMQPLRLPALGSPPAGVFSGVDDRQSRSRRGGPLSSSCRACSLGTGRVVSAGCGPAEEPEDPAAGLQRCRRGNSRVQSQSVAAAEPGGRCRFRPRTVSPRSSVERSARAGSRCI